MSDFQCNKSCPNRNSFGYCNLTICNQIRWIDKVSLDCDGNIRDFDGSIVCRLSEWGKKDENSI